MSDTQKPPREFWLDMNTEWFHKKLPTYLTKPPHQHKFLHVIEYSAYRSLMQQALAVREALAEMSESVVNNDIPDFGQRQKAYADWLKESATQALEQFDKIL